MKDACSYVLWWGSTVGCWRQDEATQSVAVRREHPTLNLMPSHSQAGACIKLVSGPWLCWCLYVLEKQIWNEKHPTTKEESGRTPLRFQPHQSRKPHTITVTVLM